MEAYALAAEKPFVDRYVKSILHIRFLMTLIFLTVYR